MLLSLLTLIIILAILGFALGLIINYVPMPAPIQKAIVVIVVLLLLLWVVRYLMGNGLISLG